MPVFSIMITNTCLKLGPFDDCDGEAGTAAAPTSNTTTAAIKLPPSRLQRRLVILIPPWLLMRNLPSG